MVDLHSHILPNIDDGSKSKRESLAILKKAYENGMTDIILTPHYILGSTYNSAKKKNEELLNDLKETLRKENIPLNLYLGNEIYIDDSLVKKLKEGVFSSLNDTKYVLFELPMNNEYKALKQILFDLQSNGYIPVIAHPERYYFLKENPKRIEELIEAGALFQSNLGSLFSRYGKEAKKTLELFLKHHMITFLSSDIHHETDTFYEDIPRLKKILRNIISEEYMEELLTTNGKKLLQNERIEPEEIIPIKKSIFKKYQ